MHSQEGIELEVKEPLAIKTEELVSIKKSRRCLWFQRIFNNDDVPNQKHHYPMFITVMCSLHIGIYFLSYINIRWKGGKFYDFLYHLWRFYVPCMRLTPDSIRILPVNCRVWISMDNFTCDYHDVFKKTCFSFMYPYQLWRFITVNFLHSDWLHLLTNLFYQCLYGITLERKYGLIRIIIIYWLANVGALLGFTLTDRENPGVGASGALYGLLLFFIMDRLIAIRINSDRRHFILLQLVLLVLLPFVITNLLMFIARYNVAHSAHFSGGLVGLLCGICIRGCPRSTNSDHRISQTVCRGIGFVLLFFYYAMTITIFFVIDDPILKWIL